MSDTDTILALAAAKGDRNACEALLRAHYDRVFALALRLTQNFHEAQDVTQEICLTLGRRLQGFRGDATLKSWIYRVVVNAVHDHRRRRATRERRHREWGALEADRLEAARGRDRLQRWLSDAIATLPADLRDTLALSFDEDLTQAQIAAILNISPGTVAWRISQVKKLLRRCAETEGLA